MTLFKLQLGIVLVLLLLNTQGFKNDPLRYHQGSVQLYNSNKSAFCIDTIMNLLQLHEGIGPLLDDRLKENLK